MRKGGGKAKGGKFEIFICRKIAKAFKVLGIKEDDIYRTKNSGATKRQPGDVQFSPKMAKLFPVLIECKHFKKAKYNLGKALHAQPKSYPIKAWMQQLTQEQKCMPEKAAILIFRQNNCPVIVCLPFRRIWCNAISLYSWAMFTTYKKEKFLMVPLDEFLKYVVSRMQCNPTERIVRER